MDQDIALLVEKAKKGDKDAFGALYELYYVPIYRFLFFKSRDKEIAEDLAQSVFVRALEAVPSFRDQGVPFVSWLYTIARNALTDYWKKKKDVAVEDSHPMWEQLSEEREHADRQTHDRERHEILQASLALLSDDQREVVILRFIEEKDYSEIAKILGKNEEALRALSYRAMKVMREYLSDKGIELN